MKQFNLKVMESMKKDLIKRNLLSITIDQKIEIILKGKEMTLANGPSLLNLSYHRKIGNHYHTDYGMIELFTELITMEHDRYLKVKYILSDEHQQLSEVYVMMKYDFYGEENEAI